MGSKTWLMLSAVLLAIAAQVGCNGGANKPPIAQKPTYNTGTSIAGNGMPGNPKPVPTMPTYQNTGSLQPTGGPSPYGTTQYTNTRPTTNTTTPYGNQMPTGQSPFLVGNTGPAMPNSTLPANGPSYSNLPANQGFSGGAPVGSNPAFGGPLPPPNQKAFQ